MTLSGAEISALEQGPPRLGLFIRLSLEPTPLRCWLGVGPIDIGVNALDPGDGELYSGFGEVLAVPALNQVIKGQASRADIALSGLDDRILALAAFSNVVQGKECDIGIGFFDSSWALLGAVHWRHRYVADFLAMTVTPAGDPSGQTIKTATLSIGSMMTGRRRAGLSFFTNQDQQARSPTDRFCERTPQYSVIGNKTWPKFS